MGDQLVTANTVNNLRSAKQITQDLVNFFFTLIIGASYLIWK